MLKHLRRVVATSGALSVIALSIVGGAPAAQAATATQRICNDKKSAGNFSVDEPNGGKEHDLARSECATVPKGSSVYIYDASYRVRYKDSGSYSDCRSGSRFFVPYQKASYISFKTYNGFNCEA